MTVGIQGQKFSTLFTVFDTIPRDKATNFLSTLLLVRKVLKIQEAKEKKRSGHEGPVEEKQNLFSYFTNIYTTTFVPNYSGTYADNYFDYDRDDINEQ